MSKPMIGMKIAVLAASGVNQRELTAIQRTLAEKGAAFRLISTDQGLVNGWDGSGWGHNFAVDAQLNTALGVDYDALIIPGGQRSMDKLKLTAHTKRFLGSFMAAMKPVAVMGDAVQLMVQAGQLAGRTIGGADQFKDMTEQAGATWSQEIICVDGALMSGDTYEGLDAYMSALVSHFLNNMIDEKQAA